MYTTSSNILIEGLRNRITFDYVNHVRVDSSVSRLTDTAMVTLPRKLSWNREQLFNLLSRGDKITVQLGYNGQLNTVFKGYIHRLHMGTPLVLECQDEMWKLKRKKLADRRWNSVMLSELLDYILPADTEKRISDLNLGEVIIENEPTTAQVLDFLRSTYTLSVFFRDDVLYAVLPSFLLGQDTGFERIVFNKYYNVVYGSDHLKFAREDEITVAVIAKTITRDNLALEWREPEIPQPGEEIKTFYCPWSQDLNSLKQFAREKLRTFKIDNMMGNFTAFGIPFTRKGDIVKYLDPEWPDRNGMSFSVQSVIYDFGLTGYRQTIQLGGRVS